ncbi:19926_t:CDS:2, partial [Cetraspora pellucida]
MVSSSSFRVCILLPTPSSGSSLEGSALSSFHSAFVLLFYAINYMGGVVIKVIVFFAD